jgi:alpha-ketoglutarate-dependent taurine dioxygenase
MVARDDFLQDGGGPPYFWTMTNTVTTRMERRPAPGATAGAGSFALGDEVSYRRWRAEKFRGYPRDAADLVVSFADPAALTREERAAVLGRCRVANMAIYSAGHGVGKAGVLAIAASFGLRRLDTPLCTGEDGVTEIQTADGGERAGYIPYSDRPLSWHTDGYYNETGKQVRGVVLHCERAAESGGTMALLDPEIAYIRLRDENPDFITALMHPEALTIPANLDGDRVIRAAQTGPVFSLLQGRLHMRYTARKRYAEWRDDRRTAEARAFLAALLEGEDLVIRHRLAPGQGLICNNVLHSRSGFSESPDPERRRLVYRARFLDRVAEPI